MSNHNEFRTSINIEYDIGNDSFLNNYLPTPSHAESIIGISKGFSTDATSSAHILVGPYGSGKSLIATILASIMSHKVSNEAVRKLIEGFNNVHQDVYQSLKQLNNINRVYIPIILNGSYEDLSEVLLIKIENELKKHNIQLILPTVKNNIMMTIKRWEEHFPSTYNQFLKYLLEVDKRAPSLDKWLEMIEENNKNEIEWFKGIYSILTSGAQFNSFSSNNLTENLNTILEVLIEQDIGLFIVHDEFGRMLQGLKQSKINKTMQDLQDIAEFVNRTKGRIQLLLISHRSMSRYMIGFFEEYQAEFERIEKRFSSYYVESDTATYYRIVERYLTHKNLNNKNLQTEDIHSLSLSIKGFNLFEELNQHEIDNLIIKGSYPLHPVTLFILPRISKVFGQNERTLFTYLMSSEPYSLHDKLKSTQGYIYADSLFKYFFSDKHLNHLYDENTKRIIDIYLSIRANLDARKTNAYKIIHFITLWELTSSNQIFQLNDQLISFATGVDLNKVQELLQDLMSLKFIHFNKVHERYELFEGSSILVEDLIEEKKATLNISVYDRLQVLFDLFEKKYFLATDYNDSKNITRFMRTYFINSSAFIKDINILEEISDPNSDGSVVYVFLDKEADYKKLKELVTKIKSATTLLAIVKQDLQSVSPFIDNLITIDILREDKKLLREYNNLDIELVLHRDNYQYEINNFLKGIKEFSDTVEWYYLGERIELTNELDLEDKISNIMWELYDKTPVIMNDAVNRFHLAGIQERSLIRIIDRILYSSEEENIGIQGYGPEYLIYATIIKNLGINLNDLDQIDDKYVKEIRLELKEFIKRNKEGTLVDLYGILASSPFGIRPPLIPVFIVILLKNDWNQFMFYRNEMYVPANEGKKIYDMFMISPEEYKYVFQSFNSEKTSFFNQLEKKFSKYISEHVFDSSQTVRVSSGMLNWLRSLPKQTQITNKFTNEQLNKLKTFIRKSEVNPLSALDEIVKLYDGNFKLFEEDVEKLVDSFNYFKNIVEKVLCDKLNINTFSDKDRFLKEAEKEDKIKNDLLSTLNNSNNIDEFCYNYIGTELKDWSDITYDLFLKQLESDMVKLSSNYEVEEDVYELTINDKYKQIRKVELSRKSGVIYNNMERMLNNAGRTVSEDEINYILLKLVNKFIN